MKSTSGKILAAVVVALATPLVHSQGTFQNLDFESGTFVPIPGDPYNRVQFGPAMPGWAGYVGTNQIDWILYNSLFLSTAGIAIYGPDRPLGEFQGHYYIVLQVGDEPFNGPRVNSAIAQTGMIPADAQSIRLYLADGSLSVSFAGQPIGLVNLGSGGGASINYNIFGGNVSMFAGQNGLLSIRGAGYLDFIQFSTQPIPEPSVFSLCALGALLLGWQFVCPRRTPPA